jgi:hypothetical protein
MRRHKDLVEAAALRAGGARQGAEAAVCKRQDAHSRPVFITTDQALMEKGATAMGGLTSGAGFTAIGGPTAPIRAGNCYLMAPTRGYAAESCGVIAGIEVWNRRVARAHDIRNCHRFADRPHVPCAACSRQLGRASAPTAPHRVHTIRGPNAGTGMPFGRCSTLMIASW